MFGIPIFWQAKSTSGKLEIWRAKKEDNTGQFKHLPLQATRKLTNPLTPMGHPGPSSQPPIDMSGNFSPHVSADSPMRIALQNKDDLRNITMLYSRVRVRTVVTLRFCTIHWYYQTIGPSKMCACRWVCHSGNRALRLLLDSGLFHHTQYIFK